MVIIDRRFCGPPASANGGYACGVAAAQLLGHPAAVEVTLRSPPPLDTPLEVERSAERAVLRHGDQRIAEAVAAVLDLAPPAPVGFDEATEAARHYPWFDGHPFPGCFVCGPHRGADDGLRILPGPVPGRTVAAAPWIPSASLADADGALPAPIVWAALDCPSWFGIACFRSWAGTPLLGRMTATIHARPRVGQRCVAAGWFLAADGRKLHAGSALFADDGGLLALARATWITVAAPPSGR